MTKKQLNLSASKGHSVYCKMMDAGLFDHNLGGTINKPKIKTSKKSKFRVAKPRYADVVKESPFPPMSNRNWIPNK